MPMLGRSFPLAQQAFRRAATQARDFRRIWSVAPLAPQLLHHSFMSKVSEYDSQEEIE
jgi:hypothetical protein